jgi:hypothetical protein
VDSAGWIPNFRHRNPGRAGPAYGNPLILSRNFDSAAGGGFRLDSPVKKPHASELARSAPPPTDRAREEPWHARADHRNRRQKRVNSLRSVMARSPWPRGSWSVRRRRPKLCERCRHRAHQAPPVFVQTSNLTFDRGIPVIRNKPIGTAFQPQPTGCYASESPPVVPAGGNDPLKNRRPVLRFLTVRQ